MERALASRSSADASLWLIWIRYHILGDLEFAGLGLGLNHPIPLSACVHARRPPGRGRCEPGWPGKGSNIVDGPLRANADAGPL
jgi:hypothetical protein